MITPQAGITGTIISSTEDRAGTLEAAGILYATGALRSYFAINKYIGVALVPEFKFKISSPPTIDSMIEIDKRMKRWLDGFNVKICFTVTIQ